MAPLGELSYPRPPERPAWLPGPVVPTAPPQPPTETQLQDRLVERRQQLREAHSKASDANVAVARAREVADRAAEQCAGERRRLAEAVAADAAIVDEIEAAIRAGETPQYANGVDKAAPYRLRVAAAEEVLARLNKQLAEANTGLAHALGAVRQAAASVVAALVDREAENLRALEREASRQHAELTAAAAWWPSVDVGQLRLTPAAAALLANPPGPIAGPVGYEQRAAAQQAMTTPWRDLYSRLVAGNADADFELEPAAPEAA